MTLTVVPPEPVSPEPPPPPPGAEPAVIAPDPTESVERDYLRAKPGIRSWLTTTDHKRIAIMFLVAVTLALILGGTFAMILRTKLLTPGPALMSPMTYNRMFTLHGVVMVFMFMIPAIPAVFGNFCLPMMLGAKDLAFPRINLASFYVYCTGAAITLWGMIHGGADTGWTFYAPYSTVSPTDVAPVAFGVFVLGVSSIMTGLNFIATTHMLRIRGMRWHDMPIFVWAIYATSVIQVIATPVLGLAVTLVALDHALHMGIFDPALGGDPVLFEHLFWFYSHPAVYIMILPAMGVIAEIVPTFSKKHQSSYRALAYSSLGIAFIGFLTWGHHLFVAGISQFDAGVFGLLSMFVAIFSAIKVFTWISTLYRGSITFNTPMLYFFAFVYLFAFGGMTGIAVATTSLDVPWHDTYFVVAHFHFIMIGGTLTAFLGAIHYWFPKMFGRMYSERWGLVSAFLVFAGFNLTFVPQFLLGNAGMPRRYYSYPARFHILNVASSLGAYLLATALILTLAYLLISLRWGARAPANPWGSRGFEWRTPSPPPVHNFVTPFDPARGAYAYDEPPPDEVPPVST
jgi:cytochrome c oxidase subunit 1